MEADRVLRPGGWFLVHFHPWLGPYGTHLEDIIPYPWANAIFSMDTLLMWRRIFTISRITVCPVILG